MGCLSKKKQRIWSVPVAWKGEHAKNRHVKQQGAKGTNSDTRAGEVPASSGREQEFSKCLVTGWTCHSPVRRMWACPREPPSLLCPHSMVACNCYVRMSHSNLWDESQQLNYVLTCQYSHQTENSTQAETISHPYILRNQQRYVLIIISEWMNEWMNDILYHLEKIFTVIILPYLSPTTLWVSQSRIYYLHFVDEKNTSERPK